MVYHDQVTVVLFDFINDLHFRYEVQVVLQIILSFVCDDLGRVTISPFR